MTENFSISEFESKDGAAMPAVARHDIELLAEQLEVLREFLGGRPITVPSGYRSPGHNESVGGAKNSQHLLGRAGDIQVVGVHPDKVADAILLLIADGKMLPGGVGRYDTFTHYDIRGYNARWDKRTKKN